MARKQRRQRGVLRVYPRGAQWWAQVPRIGRRALGLPIATTSREDAYRAAAEKYASGTLDHTAAATCRESRLTELSDKFLSENKGRWSKRHGANAAYQLGPFLAALSSAGVERIEHVTAAVLSQYERDRQESVEAATINRTIQVARAMARWAARRDPPLCEEGALARWKNLKEITRNKDPLIPSPDEWARMAPELAHDTTTKPKSHEDQATIDANARGVAVLVAVAVQTGLRIDELRHLRPGDVTRDAVLVRAYEGWTPKDHEERDVPVPAAVAELARELTVWLARAVGRNGQKLAIGPNYLALHLARAWKAAKLPGDAPRMHDARRTFATEIVRSGQGLTVARERLGHRDVSTTERYLGRYRSDAARQVPDFGVGDVLTAAPADVIPMRPRKPRP